MKHENLSSPLEDQPNSLLLLPLTNHGSVLYSLSNYNITKGNESVCNNFLHPNKMYMYEVITDIKPFFLTKMNTV